MTALTEDRGGLERVMSRPPVDWGNRWIWRAVGPWRKTKIQAEADEALVHAEDLAEALRIVLFLAIEDTNADPSSEERAAIIKVSALADLLEVAS